MLELAIVVCCLLLNGILAGLEMAFVTLSKAQIREFSKSGHYDVHKLLALRENPERTLSVLQVGITLVGALAATIGGAGSQEIIAPYLVQEFGLSPNLAQTISILGVVFPYTFLSVVVGELVPKSLAIRNPMKMMQRGTKWLVLMERIFLPLAFVLDWSTRKILKLFSKWSKTSPELAATEGLDLDGLSQEHRQYIFNLVGFRKKAVRDVFLPWEQVIFVEMSQTMAEVTHIIYTSGHTRLPVTDHGAVVGILHTKEFLILRSTGDQQWSTIIRPLVHSFENDSLIRALTVMQSTRSHLSIVYSSTGQRVGIVTMEDIFEEIIGDIFDEDDDGRLRRILANNRRARLTRSA
jgi:putative hemolysin